MKLTFLGAAETVTGSKYLLEFDNKRILIDCGLFQGVKELRLRNREPFFINPQSIDAILLTHAHLDHSGYIPLLVKEGFKGKIYCTFATADLCRILLLDAGRIQEEDTARANRYGYSKHHPALPLYTEEDAKATLKYFSPLDFNREQTLSKDTSFILTHSGHILGSSFITIKSKGVDLVFSGDLGRPNDPILVHPEQILGCNYLVLESTYGDRLHAQVNILDRLETIVNETFKRGGTIVIPAFAIGRAQTLLYYLYKLKQTNRIPDTIPIFLDSPMAIDATELWSKYSNEHTLSKEEVAQVCHIAKYVRTPEDSKKIDHLDRPAIIISASGMAEGGRVLYHLARFAPEEKNTILFTGYQAEGTRGDRMQRGEKEIKIHGERVPIRAHLENLEVLSSHADYQEILNWLKGFKNRPKQLFLTHGEKAAAYALKSRIEQTLGWNVVVPQYRASFLLE